MRYIIKQIIFFLHFIITFFKYLKIKQNTLYPDEKMFEMKNNVILNIYYLGNFKIVGH